MSDRQDLYEPTHTRHLTQNSLLHSLTEVSQAERAEDFPVTLILRLEHNEP
jgi:hypothetical protein